MPSSWLISWSFAAWTVASALAIYVLLIAFSRVIGPRAFSQMTAFDFAVTVALGAIVGSTAAGAVGLPAGLLALASLFTFRGTVAVARRHGLTRLVDNSPLLLFVEGRFQPSNLRKAKITRDDVYEALRLQRYDDARRGRSRHHRTERRAERPPTERDDRPRADGERRRGRWRALSGRVRPPIHPDGSGASSPMVWP